jgi:hypothetical protein
MIEIELALNIIRTLGLLIGVIIAVYEIMNMGKTRKMELLTGLSSSWSSLESTRNITEVMLQQFSSYDEWEEKYSYRVNPEASSRLFSELNQYNNTGMLLKNKIVEPDFIWQSWPPAMVIRLWEKAKPIVEYSRDATNDSTLYESFEYFYKETIKKYPNVTYSGRAERDQG